MLHQRPRTPSPTGFTFVEIALVLVIGGLIAGVVLTAKDFYYTARLRSIISEAAQFRDSISAFKDQYFAFPGDMSQADSVWGATACNGASCNGDGDRAIEWDTEEGVKAWRVLSLAGMVPGNFTGDCAATCAGIVGTNIPPGEYPATGWYLDNLAISGYYNFVGIGIAGQFNLNNTATSFLTPQDAQSIDIKTDEGLPNHGKVKAMPQTNPCVDTVPMPPEYNITDDDKECRLFFRL